MIDEIKLRRSKILALPDRVPGCSRLGLHHLNLGLVGFRDLPQNDGIGELIGNIDALHIAFIGGGRDGVFLIVCVVQWVDLSRGFHAVSVGCVLRVPVVV